MRNYFQNLHSSAVRRATQSFLSPNAITWWGSLVVGIAAGAYVFYYDFMGSYYGYFSGLLSVWFVSEVLLRGSMYSILGPYVYYLVAVTMALVHALIFVFSAKVFTSLILVRFPVTMARFIILAWLCIYLISLIVIRLPGHSLF